MTNADDFCKFMKDELKIELSTADEECFKSSFAKLKKYGLEDADTDEEFLVRNIPTILRIAEDNFLEQKFLTPQAMRASIDYLAPCGKAFLISLCGCLEKAYHN